MPFNGSGVFVPIAAPDYPAIPNTLIRAAQFNNNLTDIFNGLTTCITRNGQSPAQANLPMAGFKHTGAGNGSASGEYLVYGQTHPATSIDGNLTLVGAARRILADFSNATHANRGFLQTSSINSPTIVGIMPSGTGVTGQLNCYNGSDPNNAGILQLLATTAETRIASSQNGAGVTVPLTIHNGGAEALRIAVNRNVLIGKVSDNSVGGLQLGTNKPLTLETGATTFFATPVPGASDGLVWNTSISGAFWQWNINGTLAARIAPTTGNLLINTSTDDGANKLQVSGGTKTSTLTVGSGTAVNNILRGSVTTDPGNILNGGTATFTITVTGAVEGNPVFLGFPSSWGTQFGMLIRPYVSSANTVTVYLYNISGAGIDLPSATISAVVFN